MKPLQESETQGQFTVYWYDPQGTQYCEKQFCEADEAVAMAANLMNRPAIKLGIIKRIIIVDGLDCIVFEWEDGEIKFPRPGVKHA